MSIRDRFVNADEFKRTRYDKNKTQRAMCLEYLEIYGSITPLEALNAFHCFRLSAVIYNIRRDGHEIKTAINDGENKYAIYILLNQGA